MAPGLRSDVALLRPGGSQRGGGCAAASSVVFIARMPASIAPAMA
jgi:hypothetical protein